MNEKPSENNANLNPIVINAQFVKDISFEAPHVPEIYLEMKTSPDVSISVDVEAGKLQDRLFQVRLKMKAEAKIQDKTAFLCEVDYGCLAEINVPDDHLEPILLIEIPRLLFPFVRNILADLTRESGFPPLMINPIDFVGLYNQRLKDIKKH